MRAPKPIELGVYRELTKTQRRLPVGWNARIHRGRIEVSCVSDGGGTVFSTDRATDAVRIVHQLAGQATGQAS